MQKVYYTIYKTTNLLDGKIYIGKHVTRNPNDSYLGSGTRIRNAIKKHGKENFKKEILYILDSKLEMNDKEREIVTPDFCLREDVYNIVTGGVGGWLGQTLTDEHKRNLSISHKGIVCHTTPHSEETKRKISESRKNVGNRTWKFVSPENEIYETNRLKEFCKLHHLYYGNMIKVGSGERPHHKGWKKYADMVVDF